MSPQEINRRIHQAIGEPEHYEPSDFYHDLNAMRDAESWLLKSPSTDMLGMNYWNNIWLVAEDKFKTLRTIGHASAAQRAEAFLRTLGLWTT